MPYCRTCGRKVKADLFSCSRCTPKRREYKKRIKLGQLTIENPTVLNYVRYIYKDKGFFGDGNAMRMQCPGAL